jgi:hypothetical protein
VLSPVLIASTDDRRQLAIMTIDGPLGDPRHTESLGAVLPALPVGYRFVIDLSAAWGLSSASLDGLRTIAREARRSGQQVIFVCGDEARRSELILGDLDALAPVVGSLDEAIPVGRAA